MRRLLLGLAFGFMLGGIGGFGAGIFFFPYLFPPPEVNEVAADRTGAEVVARGVFIHADPSDPVHYGRGTATVYVDLVQLESDFAVGPGPKYHVYLVPLSHVTPDTRVETTMFVDLGRLKAFSGSQIYPIPDGVDLAAYGSLVIWCEQFDVLISPSRLQLQSMDESAAARWPAAQPARGSARAGTPAAINHFSNLMSQM